MINTLPDSQHYHICNGCNVESSPDECVEDVEDCEDVLCAECTAQSKEVS